MAKIIELAILYIISYLLWFYANSMIIYTKYDSTHSITHHLYKLPENGCFWGIESPKMAIFGDFSIEKLVRFWYNMLILSIGII